LNMMCYDRNTKQRMLLKLVFNLKIMFSCNFFKKINTNTLKPLNNIFSSKIMV
jgi:hypothetical protein